ncbi:hypothetical protein RU639_013819 [Aspergillus parasiticus]
MPALINSTLGWSLLGFSIGSATAVVSMYHYTFTRYKVPSEIDIIDLQTKVLELYPRVTELNTKVKLLENDGR